MAIDIGLSLFTNASSKAPGPLLKIIKRTYDSFCSTFRAITPIIFYDPKPNAAASEEYHTLLKDTFPDVRLTDSLADGYYKSVAAHTAPYIVKLEHDWVFIPENITHSIEEIVQVLHEYKIPHLRFNKRANEARIMDKSLEAHQLNNVPVCLTKWISNNPHIINRETYLDHCLPVLRKKKCSRPKDLEKQVSRIGLTGAIYGGIQHPETIIHLDGRCLYGRD